LTESSSRAHNRRSYHEEHVAEYASAHATTESISTTRRQGKSGLHHLSTESSSRVYQRELRYEESVTSHSIAKAATGSSSSTRRSQDADVYELNEYQFSRSRNVLEYVGSQMPDTDIPYPAELSLSPPGSPAPQPTFTFCHESYDHVDRQEHSYVGPFHSAHRQQVRSGERQHPHRRELRADRPNRREDSEFSEEYESKHRSNRRRRTHN
jgi:hypothetical protein